eukprot:jgi/Mesvir1/18594/Mv17103-RA.1
MALSQESNSIDYVSSYVPASSINRRFNRDNRKLCSFPRYRQAVEDVNARLKLLHFPHFSEVRYGNRLMLHPLLAVEICLAHNLYDELARLEQTFVNNDWGYQHMFNPSNPHALNTLANAAEMIQGLESFQIKEDKPGADDRALGVIVKELCTEVKRLNDTVVEVTRSRDELQKDRDCERITYTKALEDMRRIKGAEMDNIRRALARLDDTHATILELDAKIDVLRGKYLRRWFGFQSAVINVLRGLYTTHELYRMPIYYIRHFEKEVCDIVQERLHLSEEPVTDIMGRLSPPIETKVVELVQDVMSSLR